MDNNIATNEMKVTELRRPAGPPHGMLNFSDGRSAFSPANVLNKFLIIKKTAKEIC